MVSENWATCRKRRIQKASKIAVFLSCILLFCFAYSLSSAIIRTSVFACSYVCRQICKYGLELCVGNAHSDSKKHCGKKKKKEIWKIIISSYTYVKILQTTKITRTLDSFYFEKNRFKEITISNYFFSRNCSTQFVRFVYNISYVYRIKMKINLSDVLNKYILITNSQVKNGYILIFFFRRIKNFLRLKICNKKYNLRTIYSKNSNTFSLVYDRSMIIDFLPRDFYRRSSESLCTYLLCIRVYAHVCER